MKAAVFHQYGSNDVLEIKEVPVPKPGPDEVLIRVCSAAVNPVDWKILGGHEKLLKLLLGGRFPKILGMECAGEVAEKGDRVKQYKQGDPVIGACGMRLGAFAEYAVVPAKAVFPKPEKLTYDEAATVPVAGITALVAIRDKGAIAPGKKVLINGASGGVGSFGVQIAKVLGAEVTGVCSTGNAGLVKSLGADHVIDYSQEDFTGAGKKYDIIFDVVSSRSFGECKKALTSRGIYVNTLPNASIFGSMIVTSLLPGKKAATVMVRQQAADVRWMCEHIETGKIRVVIDKVFPLEGAKEALAYSETGRARGKIVLKVT